jgi:hypothetical protein
MVVMVLVLTGGSWTYTSHMEDWEGRQVEIKEQIISTKFICPDNFSMELGDLVTRLLSRYKQNRLGNIILYIIITITNIFRCQMSKSEVLSMMMEMEEENGVVFFSLVCTLVEQTEKVMRHCMKQEECGVGKVPSLPRVLPKILITTFSYLGKGEIIATMDLLKAQVAICFSKVIMFLTLIKIKKRHLGRSLF